MSHKQRQYDIEYKSQAVKLAKKMGSAAKAALKLGVPAEEMMKIKSEDRR